MQLSCIKLVFVDGKKNWGRLYQRRYKRWISRKCRKSLDDASQPF